MKSTLLTWYLLLHLCPGNTENPHVPWNLTWTLTNPETGQALRLATEVHPLDTWYPQLTFDLCVLAKDSWENTERTLQDSYPACRHSDWYICPGGKQTRQCGGPEEFYCAAWGCETSASHWGTSKRDLVSFTRTTPGESKITITFTEEGKRANWLTGKTWGLRLYVPGGGDIGILFSLRVVATPPMTVALGPIKVINPSSDKMTPPPPKLTTSNPPPCNYF